MKFASHVHGHVVAVRWLAPDVEASAELAAIVRRARARADRDLRLLLILGEDCPVPDGPTRKAMVSDHERIMDSLAGVGVLVIGQSLRQSLFRALFAGLGLLMKPQARTSLHICGGLDELLVFAEVEAKDTLLAGLLADAVLRDSEL